MVGDSEIGGDLQVEERGASLVATDNIVWGNPRLKMASGALTEGNTIGGDLQLEENRSLLKTLENRVRGNLQVFKNLGGTLLEANRVPQSLQCKENRPAPTGGRNIAGEREEQCARL